MILTILICVLKWMYVTNSYQVGVKVSEGGILVIKTDDTNVDAFTNVSFHPYTMGTGDRSIPRVPSHNLSHVPTSAPVCIPSTFVTNHPASGGNAPGLNKYQIIYDPKLWPKLHSNVHLSIFFLIQDKKSKFTIIDQSKKMNLTSYEINVITVTLYIWRLAQ